MATIMKHEWHSVDRQYVVEVDESLLESIYPDLTTEEIKQKLSDLEYGAITPDDIISDASDAGVDIEWIPEYDDWWSDRKGGYEITYDLIESNNLSDLSDDLSDDSEDESDDQEQEEVIEPLPNHPSGTYTIRVWGRTREIGVGTITKEQWQWWKDQDSSLLGQALTGNLDQNEADVPQEAQFTKEYWDYTDRNSLWGFDEDDVWLTITNQDGVEIWEGDLNTMISRAHGGPISDSFWDSSTEVDELYPQWGEPGAWVMWTQGGKGSCLQTTVTVPPGEEWDFKRLSYLTWDVQGQTVVTALRWDNVDLDDEGMDSEHDNWRGQWADWEIGFNESNT